MADKQKVQLLLHSASIACFRKILQKPCVFDGSATDTRLKVLAKLVVNDIQSIDAARRKTLKDMLVDTEHVRAFEHVERATRSKARVYRNKLVVCRGI